MVSSHPNHVLHPRGPYLKTQVGKALLTGFQARPGGSFGEGLAVSPVRGRGRGRMELWASRPFPATLWACLRKPGSLDLIRGALAGQCLHQNKEGARVFLGGGHSAARCSSRTPATFQQQ